MLISFSVTNIFLVFLLHVIAFAYTINSSISYHNENDYVALMDFKSKIVSDPHGITKSWNASVHFCNWAGVECGLRHRRVTTINISNSGVVGSLSSFLGNLSFLHELVLWNNTFRGNIPPEIVYGLNPISPLDLAPLPGDTFFSGEAEERAKSIKKMHEEVRAKILKQNERYRQNANKHKKYVEFHPGDMVWIHLQKDRFPPGTYGKLKPRADGPFKVLQRIGENAYKIELPENYGVSNTFNVADLSLYHGENASLDSRTSLFQPGELDTGVPKFSSN